MTKPIDFTLCAGIWEYWFRDKETLKPLSPRLYVGELINNKNHVSIPVPEDLINNKNAECYIQRTR